MTYEDLIDLDAKAQFALAAHDKYRESVKRFEEQARPEFVWVMTNKLRGMVELVQEFEQEDPKRRDFGYFYGNIKSILGDLYAQGE